MKNWLALLALAILSYCTQTSQVFAPVNNVTSDGGAPPATYTLTLQINSNNSNHQNKAFSALLFRGGTLYAAQYNAGAQTDATGAATLTLNGVNSPTNCPTATPAALEAGTYTLYFAIEYGAETVTVANPANGSCGANGWINSSSGGNLYGTIANITINGNTTYTINHTNLVLFLQHTFDLQAGYSEYACVVSDISVTSYSVNLQPLAVYARNGNGTTTGSGGTTFRLPAGSYRYFCSGGANTTHFEAGVDFGATGILTVSGAGTTLLNSGNFSPL